MYILNIFLVAVELLADHHSFSVTVRQIGPNSSAVNNKKLLYGETTWLKHGDILQVNFLLEFPY